MWKSDNFLKNSGHSENQKQKSVKNFLLDLFFPKFCFSCRKEGTYLCEDCLATLEISENFFCLCQKPKILAEPGKCSNCKSKYLDGLYFALPFENNLLKGLIHKFKYEPYARELSETLALLILTHFQAAKKQPSAENSVIVPVPSLLKKTRKRGFSPPQEIAKIISLALNIPLIPDCLVKTRGKADQVNLKRQERMLNVLGVFSVNKPEDVKNKTVLLVDDVYTTGATTEECAKILKQSGAEKVWGIAVAREELKETIG